MDDFSKLAEMKYSGRGITIGMTLNGEPFVGYTLTGRSPASQARKLVYDEIISTIRTDVTNPSQLKQGDIGLLIYPAVVFVADKQRIVASNGVQTNLISDFAKKYSLKHYPADVLLDSMITPVYENGVDITTYEPDAPNFTPRISGCLDSMLGGLYIARKSSDNEDSKNYSSFPFILKQGKARLITTYHGGNETPLLPFGKKPLEAKIQSSTASQICESLYSAIGPKDGENYRVAAAVMVKKRGGLDVAVINRFDRGR